MERNVPEALTTLCITGKYVKLTTLKFYYKKKDYAITRNPLTRVTNKISDAGYDTQDIFDPTRFSINSTLNPASIKAVP